MRVNYKKKKTHIYLLHVIYALFSRNSDFETNPTRVIKNNFNFSFKQVVFKF